MNYFSLNNNASTVTFREAVQRGLAPDRGLYFPNKINPLSNEFWNLFESMSQNEIAFHVIQQFVGDSIPENHLQNIINDTLCFEFPIVSLSENIASLELFHGPTMAFKDVGARFMARCLGYFNKQNPKEITVLVATSGDTGGAVASGFLGVSGVDVVILFPKGKVSHIQELQLTTNGQNIRAIEIDGVFDDCQEIVKTAFLDAELNQHIQLTSANSINVARWLPQSFYFFFAYQQLIKQHKNRKIIFSVPSGNFGNICAGLVAKKLGLPVAHFIASTNSNDTVPRYMDSTIYKPKPSVQTISNAMDVGNPSNFIRIQKLCNNDFFKLKKIFSAYSFTDKQTREALKEIYNTSQYIADPHGAIGYLGLKNYLNNHPDNYGVFLETAHPVKFLDVVEKSLNIKVDIPSQIETILDKESEKTSLSSFEEVKKFLLQKKT